MTRTVFVDSVNPALFVPAPAPTYQGPGDIIPGALGWWGLRGYSAAYSTGYNPAITIIDDVFINPITINILSNGKLDVLTLTNWVAAHSVSSILVETWYDQSGNGKNLINHSSIPNLVLNVLSGYPVIRFLTSSTQDLFISSGITQSQPFLISWVASRTGAPTEYDYVLASNAGSVTSGFRPVANTVFMNAGTNAVATATDNAFHAVQANYNGNTTSDIMVDGSSTSSLSPGTNGLASSMYVGNDGVGTPQMNGDIVELGIWAGNQSANEAALNTNQHGTNGYNF